MAHLVIRIDPMMKLFYNGEITEEELATALFYLLTPREVLFNAETEAERKEAEFEDPGDKLNFFDAFMPWGRWDKGKDAERKKRREETLVPAHRRFLEVLLRAEAEGRCIWPEPDYEQVYSKLNALLKRNGYPELRVADASARFTTAKEVDELVRNQLLNLNVLLPPRRGC